MIVETVLSVLVLAAFVIDLAIKVVHLVSDGLSKRPNVTLLSPS